MTRKLCNIGIELGVISLLIFPPLLFGAVQFQHRSYIQAVIFAIALCWTIKSLRKDIIRFLASPLDLPLFALLLWGLVNLVQSTYTNATERELYLLFNYVILYLVVVQHLKTVRRLIGLAFLMTLIGSGEALFGLLQYLQGAKTVLGYPVSNIGTVNATYISHNHFAGLLILIIPIAIGLLLGSANIEKRIFVFVLIGLMGTALVLSLSRGGLLSMFIAIVFLSTIQLLRSSFSTRKVISVLLVLGVVGAGIGFFVNWIGVSPIAHRSLLRTFVPGKEAFQEEIRFSLWTHSLAAASDFPFFGSGLGTFHDVFLRHRPTAIPQDKQAFHAHNDYLELLVEMGLIGLAIFLWGILRFFRYILRGIYQSHDPVLVPLALGGLSSCVAILCHSFFDFNLHIPANALIAVVVAAMTTATVHLILRGRRSRRKTREIRIYQITPSWKFVVVMLCLLMVMGFNFRKNIAVWYYGQAKTAASQQRLFEAVSLYQRALAFNSGDALFHKLLGELYTTIAESTPYSEKWYHLALQEYQKAIALNAYEPDHYYQSARSYNALEQPENAIFEYRRAITANPHVTLYYELLGQYLLTLGQIDAAMEVYQQAVQIHPPKLKEILTVCHQFNIPYQRYQHLVPDVAKSRKIFAEALAQANLWQESLLEYRKAIDLSGGQPEYYDALTKTCRIRNDVSCLRSIWQERWEREPDNINYPKQLAESFAREQRWDEAIALYAEMAQQNPQSADILQRLAQLYQQQGNPEQALNIYHQLTEQEPTNPGWYHQRAAVYQQAQDWQAAATLYEEALAEGLTHADVYSALGQLYSRLNRMTEARDMYVQAIQAGETRMAIYKDLERIYLTQNNTLEAELLWESYVLANKDNLDALFALATSYQQEGEWLKAVNLAKEIVANAPTNVHYRSFLAGLYEQQGMLYEAIEHWEKIVRLNPNAVEAHLHVAQLYEQNHQWQAAREHYNDVLRIQPDHPVARQKLNESGG